MSRRFNTKKFIKNVLNGRYALVIGNEIVLDTKQNQRERFKNRSLTTEERQKYYLELLLSDKK